MKIQVVGPRFFSGNWSSSEDLYDSDDYNTEYEGEDSFEALCRFEAKSTPNTSCSSLDLWLRKVEYPASLPRTEKEQWIKANGGGERSVFTNLVQKPDGPAAGTEFPACAIKAPTSLPPQCRLVSHPIMSCRVTPEGETLFNLQWVSK